MSANPQPFPFIRIIELPAVKMARSGQGGLEPFNQWWSAMDAQDENRLFPKDFMWFNPKLGAMEWLYAFPNGLKDTDGYEVFDFPGGLYAVAACNDDGPEIEKTNALIHQWIAHSKIFAEAADEAAPRYDMGHVITPRNAKEIMGNHQMDLFVPITYHKQ